MNGDFVDALRVAHCNDSRQTGHLANIIITGFLIVNYQKISGITYS